MPSETGSWAVRMAVGAPEIVGALPVLERRSEPIFARNTEELEQVLGGIFAAISLLGPGKHLQLNIDWEASEGG